MCTLAKSNQTGFTLIEIIIALTVFVVGIVSIAPLFSSGLRILGDSDKKIAVANLARAKMTEIETQGFIESITDTPRTAFPAPFDTYEYEITWTKKAYDTAASNNHILYQVDLTIYWMGGSGELSEHFVTYLTRMEPY